MIIDTLAAYRITRLIVEDTITAPMRDMLVRTARRAGGPETAMRTAELLACPWCTGFWVAAGVVAVRRTRWWRTVADVLAMSAVIGLISERA